MSTVLLTWGGTREPSYTRHIATFLSHHYYHLPELTPMTWSYLNIHNRPKQKFRLSGFLVCGLFINHNCRPTNQESRESTNYLGSGRMWEAGGWKTAEAAEGARKGRNISEADASCRHWGSLQRKLAPLLGEVVLLLIFFSVWNNVFQEDIFIFSGKKRAILRHYVKQ